MSKRKANQTNIDDLIDSMNNSLILDQNEYDLLMTAYESKLTDANIESIIEAASRRYIRYLRAEIFEDHQYIETKINRYLQIQNGVNTPMCNLDERFNRMKEIDGLIVTAIECEFEANDKKRQRTDETDTESESESESEIEPMEID
ncbi:MAG: hypothetical protein EBU90_15040 [Proteobacteria bacterium]|nr:hypothetical protein [Pseudomonadota bacterium]NBP15306.1 hypothetical protein [bacterium]